LRPKLVKALFTLGEESVSFGTISLAQVGLQRKGGAYDFPSFQPTETGAQRANPLARGCAYGRGLDWEMSGNMTGYWVIWAGGGNGRDDADLKSNSAE